MSIILYNIFLWLYRGGIHIASLFNAKAYKWVSGRRDIIGQLEKSITPGNPVIWMHCASLGEFEQGRPVLEELKRKFPAYRILLTFFSPSGFEALKNYSEADWVYYMPLDGARTAKRFLEIVKPSLVIFVKYEFWFYYLKKIKYRNIPLILISAIFREHMTFFKWYGGLQRKMLSRFDHLFLQDMSSKKLASNIGLDHISSVSGDTRFDRVIEIAEKFSSVPGIDTFLSGHKAIVAGSTWEDDEMILASAMTALSDQPLKLIIAPHEITEKNLYRIGSLFTNSVLYSEFLANQETKAQVLIIDNIGMLSRLYFYAYITYIGGGLSRSGIHNVLEAAVYYKPVLFGPHYQKYTEAVGLVQAGGGLPFTDTDNKGRMLYELVKGLLENNEDYKFASNAAGNFVRKSTGATRIITNFIQEKRLLTN